MERIEWIEEYLDEAMRLAYDAPIAIGGHEPAIRLLDKLLFEEPGYGRLHFTLGKVYYNFADDQLAQRRISGWRYVLTGNSLIRICVWVGY